MPSSQNTFILHVHGMHCTACVLLTESATAEHPKVSSARSSLETRSMEICGDFGDMAPEEIAKELGTLLSQHGYKLSTEPERKEVRWRDFMVAIPAALAFVVAFVGLQRLGIVNLVGGGGVTYGTAFVVGIVASLSTCMAVVGGLVLSMSATLAKGGDRVRPQVLFHAGRLVAFFILGGAIGALGAAFQLGQFGTFALSLLVGIVMLVLGINLLEVFPWAKKLQPSVPRFLSSRALDLTKINHTLTPVLAGVATFFLPCGFTQSMQVYSLSTGSFLRGALTMLVFALGTLPVLALVSVSSLSIRGPKAGVFFKAAGIVVVLFAVFNILNSLVVAGVLPPIFNF
jgi:sulfite exporter TauE/SafE